MSTPQLVTKESLQAMLSQADDTRKAQIVGRALVALFRRQTESEQAANVTSNCNSVGFASSDAKGGCLTAKSFLKNGTLLDWQLERWMRPQRDGFPRICKYVRQLNAIAAAKAEARHNALEARYKALCLDYSASVDSDDPAIITPILNEMKAIESQLGNVPYRIHGSIVV